MKTKRFLLALVSVLTAAVSFAADNDNEQELTLTLWQSPDKPAVLTAPSHRIPALVRCGDGSLLAVADYRLHLSDIGGNGGGMTSQIELRYRRSNDGGLTWTEQATVCERNTSSKSSWKWAMGDASLVADRESGNVLMMCAAGSVGMGASTAANPIKIGCFRSTDYGQTWDEGTEITSQIYGLYEGDATAIFITSGSLCQSKQIKIGDYYRIYAAYPVRTKTNGNGTGVIYSDDFGQTWTILGDKTFAEGLVYEEGKVAELPDGSVALMVRDDSGAPSVEKGKKNFCRYIYNNVETGEGQWTTAVSGITGMANACNNTLLIVPAMRTADNKEVSLALVALPFHTNNARDAVNNYGRKDVGFVYKEIDGEDDYADGQALAQNWKKGMQVTDKFSAYTDLLAMENQQVALLAEDNGKQGRGLDGNNECEAYDIIFRTLNLSTITNGEYTAIPAEEPDGISEAEQPDTAIATSTCYDLSGRMATSNTGILISNGKKTIRK